MTQDGLMKQFRGLAKLNVNRPKTIKRIEVLTSFYLDAAFFVI